MAIQLQISPRIIPSIASLYNDKNRIFMEYIDNSIDSADQNYFDQKLKSYNKPIKITLQIKGSNYKDGRVIITDNCFGITNFTKVVESIGDSDKKKSDFTNGQFGYGIYSFMAACDDLEIISKLQRKSAYLIKINKGQFDTAKQEDVKFDDPKVINDFENESGTRIILTNFDKHSWNQIDIAEIKNEIEKHFELLLSRGNLIIKLVDQNGEEFICSPFDYDQYEGEIYEDYITDLHLTRGKTNYTMPAKIPLHIFLKITKGRSVNKIPVFIAKGRRIGEIKDIKAFRSSHKNDLWGHPNVTGFIDLKDFIEPTIARNDFKNNNHSKALFKTLLDLEPYIMEFIGKINKRSEERHYKELEDRLNSALSKLARIDAMNFRTDYLSGNEINLKDGGTGQDLSGESGKKDRGEEDPTSGEGGKIGENEGMGNQGVGDNPGSIPGGESEGESPLNEENDNPFEDSEFKGGKKKKSGFNIRIVDVDPDIDSATEKPLRSTVVGDEIRIFKKHPDFEERVRIGREGDTKITQRLVTYLAGEITVHYKDRFYIKTGQPEYNKQMFVGMVGFIYQFESLLSDLVNKNLSDFS